MGVFIVILIVGFFAFAIVAVVHDHKKGIPQAQAAAKRAATARIICPHCQVAGRVTSRAIKQKKGVSGGKATGAILTGGVSLLATGLSRREGATRLSCGNCGTTWTV